MPLPNRPHWCTLLVLVTLTGVLFWVPQEVPLVWAVPNSRAEGTHYLRITCSATEPGAIRIYLNYTNGINEFDTLAWPANTGGQDFTYVFPLRDAPLVEIRLDPPAHGAALDIRSLSIVTRSGREVHRFTPDQFLPTHQVNPVEPLPDGWRLRSFANADDPFMQLQLAGPLLPEGANRRNLIRCLFSTGYLTLILGLVFLFIALALRRPLNAWWLAYGALAALLFAVVGNRELIRQSMHFARFIPPPAPAGFRLELDVASSGWSPVQIYWDVGQGITGALSSRREYLPHSGLQTVRLELPAGPVRALRWDPRDNPGKLVVQGLRVVDQSGHTQAILPVTVFNPVNQIAQMDYDDGNLTLVTTPDADDAIAMLSDEGLGLLNAVLADGRPLADR